jgi:hypothetical protein
MNMNNVEYLVFISNLNNRAIFCSQHDLQVDYYGKRLATCSSDRIIKIFDVGPEPGQQTLSANIAGHDGPVWQVRSVDADAATVTN